MRSPAQAVEQVSQSQEGMAKHHPRTRVPHHRADLLPHRGMVTVDGAVGAGGLGGLIWTLIQASQGVAQEVIAGVAEGVLRPVAPLAGDVDHRPERFTLPRQSRMSSIPHNSL